MLLIDFIIIMFDILDSATKNLNMNVDLSIVDTLYSIDERVRKSRCKIVTSKCFVYSVCKLLNGFVLISM